MQRLQLLTLLLLLLPPLLLLLLPPFVGVCLGSLAGTYKNSSGIFRLTMDFTQRKEPLNTSNRCHVSAVVPRACKQGVPTTTATVCKHGCVLLCSVLLPLSVLALLCSTRRSYVLVRKEERCSPELGGQEICSAPSAFAVGSVRILQPWGCLCVLLCFVLRSDIVITFLCLLCSRMARTISLHVLNEFNMK